MSTADDDAARARAAARAARRARAAARERGYPAPQAPPPPPPADEPSAMIGGLRFLGRHKIVTGIVVFLIGYWAITGTSTWQLLAVILIGAVLFDRFVDWDIDRRKPVEDRREQREIRARAEREAAAWAAWSPPPGTPLSASGRYVKQGPGWKTCSRCGGSGKTMQTQGVSRVYGRCPSCLNGRRSRKGKTRWVPVELADWSCTEGGIVLDANHR